MHSPLQIAPLILLLAPAAAGQTVLVVGQSDPQADFTEIQPAVDAAAEGDVILVRSGSYDRFEVDGKSLTIAGDPGAFPIVADFPPPGGALIRVRDLAPDQSVTLRRLFTEPNTIVAPAVALDLQDNQGPVWVEDCLISMFNPLIQVSGDVHGLQARNSASVVVVGSTCVGNRASQGLEATDSAVFAFGSTFEGGFGTFDAGLGVYVDGGHGARLDGGSLFASGCSFQGGNGTSPFSPCTAVASGGGDGVLLAAGDPAFDHLDTVLAGGSGGIPTPFCPTAAPGSSGSDLTVLSGTANALPGTAHGVAAASPLRVGEVLDQLFTGAPGELVFEVLAGGQTAASFAPQFAGALVLGQPQFVFFHGTLDGAGSLQQQDTIPPLAPGVEGRPLYLLPVFLDPVSLALVLGAPTAVLLLE